MQHGEEKDAILVLTSFPNLEKAQQLGKELVEQKTVKCISFLPAAVSIYEWEGKVEVENEVLALMKTKSSCWEKLQEYFTQNHPYDVPELIKLPIEAEKKYLHWLMS